MPETQINVSQDTSFWEKNKKAIVAIVIVVIIVSLIVLPTGTPEDLVTTVPLFAALGWKEFLIIAAIAGIFLIIALSVLQNPTIKEEYIKRTNLK